MKQSSSITFSIIIPTCNRADFLKETLESLPLACEGQDAIELLVIDNGSKDHTRSVVEAFALKAPFPVAYHFAPCPGLHVGRNLGAQLAAGSILAYLDDDVIVQPGWARAILSRFASRSDIALTGGPCRPFWEIEPPKWLIRAFQVPLNKGWYIGVLSLIDLGDEPQEVPGKMIFGCNFAVRKEILMELKGFHPDGVPDRLLRYRGDGESGVGEAIDAAPGITAFYDPDILVLHRVPAKRLTPEYLLHIAKRSGYGNAFIQYRKERPNGCFGRLRLMISEWWRLLRVLKWRALAFRSSQQVTQAQWQNKLLLEKAKHLTHICLSRTVSRWVCQESYFAEDPCPYWSQAPQRDDA